MKALVDLHVYYTRLTDIAANLPSVSLLCWFAIGLLD
jgi:hypothetical protein